MPDYRMTTTVSPAGVEPVKIERLVRAKNEARAIAHVVKDTITIERATTDDVIRLTAAAVKLEQAA